MVQVKVVKDGIEAKRAIEHLFFQGFTKNDVYVLAHDKDRSKLLTEALELKKIGVKKKGILDLTANVLPTRAEELRSKMESLGLSDSEAKQYEEELAWATLSLSQLNKAGSGSKGVTNLKKDENPFR